MSITPSPLTIASAVVLSILVATTLLRKKRQSGYLGGPWLSELPDGPKPSSWMAGCFHDLSNNDNLGETDQEYVKQYGLAFKMPHIFGSDMLYLADPQGLHHVLDTRNYLFHKRGVAKLNRMIFGPNILGAEDSDHARQRKVLAPGFHQSIVKDIVPIFAQGGAKLIGKWNDIITMEEGKWSVVDIHSWLSRATLDAIGQGVFSYDFGALGDSPSEFAEVYKNVFFEMLHKRSPVEITSLFLLPYLPLWIMVRLKGLAFRTGMERFKKMVKTGRKIASDIVNREVQAAEGQIPQGKDVMSSLVRANISEDPKQRMTEDELLSQTLILTIAGHDTSASTLTWILYELGRNPNVQKKLREEIIAFKASVGGREYKASDFESQNSQLPYATAVIKETLRFYLVAAHLLREAGSDDMIPLSVPVKTRDGKLSDSLSIRKGQTVLISLWSYNRVKELWGEDADIWNPERFLDKNAEKRRHALGVYANLGTFGSGVHSCIGWRFAVMELHALLVTIIEKFEFGLPPEDISIVRVGTSTMSPAVKGQEDQGAQLPLRIRPVAY